jgi:hypothetical protein
VSSFRIRASAVSTSGGTGSRSLRRSFRRSESAAEKTCCVRYTSLTVHRGTLVPLLERIQTPLQIRDHLAPSLGEGERFFPGCRQLRTPAEVQVETNACEGREGRQHRDDLSDDGGHPAQARDLNLRARSGNRLTRTCDPGAGSPDVGTPAAERRPTPASSSRSRSSSTPLLRPARSQNFPANCSCRVVIWVKQKCGLRPSRRACPAGASRRSRDRRNGTGWDRAPAGSARRAAPGSPREPRR